MINKIVLFTFLITSQTAFSNETCSELVHSIQIQKNKIDYFKSKITKFEVDRLSKQSLLYKNLPENELNKIKYEFQIAQSYERIYKDEFHKASNDLAKYISDLKDLDGCYNPFK